MDYDKQVLPNQTNNGTECLWAWPNTERDHEWSEENMIEFTAKGLWFAPQCLKWFQTNKYLHHGDKICGHTWQAHRLDKTGDYILSPSPCWHKGFYHDKFNKTVIQVQLFAAPSMGNALSWVKTSSMETSTNPLLPNLPTISSQGGMRVTLCWNSHHAPNSKRRMLFLSRTGKFLKKICIRCHSFKNL
jgi:hypothetical protein